MSDELVVWRQTVAGPELLIGGIVVREWLGTNHNEAAALLAGKINSAIESKLVEREAATVERCAKPIEDLWESFVEAARQASVEQDKESDALYCRLANVLLQEAQRIRSLFPDPNYAERIRAEARLEEAEFWNNYHEWPQRVTDLEAQLSALKPEVPPEAGKEPHA